MKKKSGNKAANRVAAVAPVGARKPERRHLFAIVIALLLVLGGFDRLRHGDPGAVSSICWVVNSAGCRVRPRKNGQNRQLRRRQGLQDLP